VLLVGLPSWRNASVETLQGKAAARIHTRLHRSLQGGPPPLVEQLLAVLGLVVFSFFFFSFSRATALSRTSWLRS
jgi:hypothetical protein